MTETTLRCPNCGQPAQVELHWDDAGRVEVGKYRCPSDCQVDDESIRQIVSSSDN